MRRSTRLIHRKLEFSISSSQNRLHYFSVGCQHFPDDAVSRTEQHRGERTELYKEDLLLFSFLSPKLIFCIFQHCFFTGTPTCLRHFLFYSSPCLCAWFYIIGIQHCISGALKTLVSAFLVPLISSNEKTLTSETCSSSIISLLPFCSCRNTFIVDYEAWKNISQGYDSLLCRWSRTWETRQVSLEEKSNKLLIYQEWGSFCGKILEKAIKNEQVYCCN